MITRMAGPTWMGCDPMESGYDPKNVERTYRQRIAELERRLEAARATLRQTAIELDELGFSGPARSIRAALAQTGEGGDA